MREWFDIERSCLYILFLADPCKETDKIVGRAGSRQCRGVLNLLQKTNKPASLCRLLYWVIVTFIIH
ncbi:hypothetical protein DPMN_165620 [Dreissena polymorpha]|uniref:Uncharacterized protein n=1 Tax=Dreissena polymorpha TaxID=45954 RepID=A0A9D4F010_DREPO|nr:hypothetical protein DPMN_165620 [Dreissena polymorpha]